MLHYAVVFFVIALIAALFGFGGIAASAAGIAKILFVLFRGELPVRPHQETVVALSPRYTVRSRSHPPNRKDFP